MGSASAWATASMAEYVTDMLRVVKPPATWSGLRDSPGRSGVPTEIAYGEFCQLRLEELNFLDNPKGACFAYPPKAHVP